MAVLDLLVLNKGHEEEVEEEEKEETGEAPLAGTGRGGGDRDAILCQL